MILSDNETSIDRLNNMAIAKTIVSIIKDSKESVSIGVHGDWGAGKSSVLAMVEAELNSNSVLDGNSDIDDWDETEEEEWESDEETEIDSTDVVIVRFNSWQYQGFEDAKIALMSAIVSQVEKKSKHYYKKHKIKGGLRKLKEIGGKVWTNLDKLSIAKSIGKTAVSIATGTAPLAIINSMANHIKETVTDREKVEELIGVIGGLIKDTEIETSGYKEMEEFRRNFNDLFREAHAGKLVVLIDDLDRCLPRVAIETLEAVRMFLSLDNAAFIIAADDLMIRYSVIEYFPRIIEQDTENKDIGTKIDYNRFADKYLEKLIQIPLHIPRIGIAEAQLYIMLLLIESELSESDGLKSLVNIVINKLHKPWALEQLSTKEIKEALGDSYSRVVGNIAIAKSIDKILAENTNGNPRNIKRFVNMLLLRTEVSYNRGFAKEDLEMAVLAKMMLAEQYNGEFYKALAAELNEDGVCLAFEVCAEKDTPEKIAEDEEHAIETEGDPAKLPQPKKRSGGRKVEKPYKPVVRHESFRKFLEQEDVKAWMETEPPLTGRDLRPYFFACAEKNDFFFSSPEERLRELISIVRGGKFNVANKKEEILKLENGDAKRLFKIVSQDIFIRNISENKTPKVVEGVRKLVEFRVELQEDLAEFLLTLPFEKLGIWAVGGWDACIPKSSMARSKLNQFFKEIEINSTDDMIKAAAKKAQV